MLSDDVFRHQLEKTIAELEAFAATARDVADIDISAAPAYWRMTASPRISGACPFDLVLQADQRFNLRLADEVYTDRLIEDLAMFPNLARAIAAGGAERIETLNAFTGTLEAIEIRIEQEDGAELWSGSRWLRPNAAASQDAQERRTQRFLPYRR